MMNLTSRSSTIAKHIKKLGKSKSYRDEHGQFLCVGEKLFEEALKNGCDIEVVITSKNLEHELSENVRVYYADDSIIDSLSPTQNSQGLIFTCNIPTIDNVDHKKGTHILLDCIQDPGNLGTIIRSALAFGMDSVILTDGCADIYNPKTVRASMGAIFKQSVVYMTRDEIDELKSLGVRFIVASNEADSVDISKARLNDSIIVLGSEGQGVSDYLTDLCDDMIKIPISPDVESINVSTAASIIMWETSK